jgi:outer membrane biosynthesis protein TonB
MRSRFDNHYTDRDHIRRFRLAVFFSAFMHLAVLGSIMARANQRPPIKAAPMFQVEFVGQAEDAKIQSVAPLPEPEPEPEPEPVPEPPPPEPKPEVKPEPPKEQVEARVREEETARKKAEEALRKVEEEKRQAEETARKKKEEDEKKKVEEARLRKEEEKKELKRTEEEKKKEEERKKKEEEAKKNKAAEEAKRKADEAAKKVDAPTGVSMQAALPGELAAWSRLVQRKVDRTWVQPVGVRLDLAANQAVVAVWVSRNGSLMGRPEIIQNASDPALGESAIRAVIEAAPFPPFPETFTEPDQQVVFTFTLNELMPAQ